MKSELAEKGVAIDTIKPSAMEEKKQNIDLSSNAHAVNQERLKLN